MALKLPLSNEMRSCSSGSSRTILAATCSSARSSSPLRCVTRGASGPAISTYISRASRPSGSAAPSPAVMRYFSRSPPVRDQQLQEIGNRGGRGAVIFDRHSSLSYIPSCNLPLLRGAPPTARQSLCRTLGRDLSHLLAHPRPVHDDLHARRDQVARRPIQRDAGPDIRRMNPNTAGIVNAIMFCCAGSTPGDGDSYDVGNMETITKIGKMCRASGAERSCSHSQCACRSSITFDSIRRSRTAAAIESALAGSRRTCSRPHAVAGP